MENKKNNNLEISEEWLIEYKKTTDFTRIDITKNITLIISLFFGVSISLIKIFSSYNWIFFLIEVLVNTIVVVLSFYILKNAKMSSELNKIKFQILIEYEKQLFKTSLYEEEWKRIDKKMFSQIDKILGIVFIVFSIIMVIVSLILLCIN